MEKRTLIAVVLSLAILLGWTYFQKKLAPPPPPATEQQAPLEAEQKPAAPAEKAEAVQPVTTPVEPLLPADTKADNIVVETDLYRAVFSTKGAILRHWELKNYKDADNMPVVLLKEPGVIPPLGIIFDGSDRHMPQRVIYAANTKNIVLSKKKTRGELTFTFYGEGMSITKQFIFYNDNYNVDLNIQTDNTPSYLLPVGTGFGIFNPEAGSRSHAGPVVLAGSDKDDFTEKSDNIYIQEAVKWIAQEDQYFTAAIIPLGNIEGADFWKEGSSPEIALKMKAGAHHFTLYAGPKEYDRLKQLNAGLEHIIDFGWFSVVAMPLFWVLKYFYSFFGNYGWSIILLTIVTRIPFIPIMHKSQQSMKKMSKIQPMMAELKEKYKNDSAKMQKEMMQLYKKHKVNPVGGCLPMFLQIPVFIALYNVLLKAIELRGAPFIFWITDLSAKDPYYVLPIVMGLTMVLQQKMTPSAMDPKQAKMMMLMPIVFTIMFLQFASGLVIYWLVNNVLGIAQQFYANKKAEK